MVVGNNPLGLIPDGLSELMFPAERLKTTKKHITNSSTLCLSTAAKLSVKLLHCDHRQVGGGPIVSAQKAQTPEALLVFGEHWV